MGTLHVYVGALNEREIDLGDEWGAGCNKERLYEQNIKIWKLLADTPPHPPTHPPPACFLSGHCLLTSVDNTCLGNAAHV